MDIHEYRWALVNSSVSYRGKILGLVLAQYANSKTLKCYPSLDTLQGKCSMSINTLRKAVKELEESLFLHIDREGTKKRFKHIYTLIDGSSVDTPNTPDVSLDVSLSDSDVSIDVSTVDTELGKLDELGKGDGQQENYEDKNKRIKDSGKYNRIMEGIRNGGILYGKNKDFVHTYRKSIVKSGIFDMGVVKDLRKLKGEGFITDAQKQYLKANN